MPNTVKELRNLCASWPSVFRGYSKLRKADLLEFMKEHIERNGLITIDEDGRLIDVEEAVRIIRIEPAQDPDEISSISSVSTLEVFEDIVPMEFPPVPPPIESPPQRRPLAEIWDLSLYYPHISEQQWEDIHIELEDRILMTFTEKEIETMEELNAGLWTNLGGQVVNMTSNELIAMHLIDALNELTYDIFMEYDAIIEPHTDIKQLVNDREVNELAKYMRYQCLTRLKPCPECPVCYQKKPGMTVKTCCGHEFCLTCLNKTWEARGGIHTWTERPCPMCRKNVENFAFV